MKAGAAALVALSIALVPLSLRATADPSAPRVGVSRRLTWMAAGDSYSAGEGIRGTGVHDPCARSEQAYGPLAAHLLRSQRGWSIAGVSHNACTGRLVGDFYNGIGHPGGSLRDWGYRLVPPAAGRFDVVTMTFGGNDIGFSKIMQGCLDLPLSWAEAARDARLDFGCSLTEDEIEARVDRLVAGTPSLQGARPFGPHNRHETLANFYADVANRELTADGVLVVLGYPRLFEPSSAWGRWRGAMCAGVFADDADMLGRVGDLLDAKLQQAVTEAGERTAHQVRFVPMADAYSRHSLCARDTEWLNGLSIGFWDRSARRDHSFHPNEIGHRVMAERVAEIVSAIAPLQPDPPVEVTSAPRSPRPAQPLSNTPPPINGGSRFGVGDEFDDRCTVAWPTAPTRTSRYIQMTMTCVDTPQQFTFVDVAYPDPDLPMTPSTGQVHVHGRVEDIATSEYGFKVLVVLADRIEMP